MSIVEKLGGVPGKDTLSSVIDDSVVFRVPFEFMDNGDNVVNKIRNVPEKYGHEAIKKALLSGKLVYIDAINLGTDKKYHKGQHTYLFPKGTSNDLSTIMFSNPGASIQLVLQSPKVAGQYIYWVIG